MTPLDVTQAASTQFQHWWEMHGLGVNPTSAIRRIAGKVAMNQPQVRYALEAYLQDELERLRALEGDEL